MIQPEDRWEPWPVDIEHGPPPDRTYDENEAGEPLRFLGFSPIPTPPHPPVAKRKKPRWTWRKQ